MPEKWSFKERSELNHLEADTRPTWVYDIELEVMWWANSAALDFWKADSLQALIARDFKSNSAAALSRLKTVVEGLDQGGVAQESWTFYPLDEPVYTLADHRPVGIESGRSGVLIQVQQILPKPADAQTMRLIEAARYTNVMVTMFDEHGQLLTENPAALAFRTRHPEVRGTTLAEHLNDPGKAEQVLSKVIERQGIRQEHSFKLGDETRVHQLTAKRGRDPMTGSAAVFVTEEDITDQLKQSEDRYQAIFDFAADAILISDPTRPGFLEMNRQAEAMFGISREEFNSGAEKFFHRSPEYQPDGQRSLDAARAYAKRALAGATVTFEWTFLDLKGQPMPSEVTLTRFPNPGGPRLIRSSIRNISDRKQAEQQRQDLEHQLIQAQKLESLGQLTGGVAHDFNNLLAVIMGNLELLSDQTVDANQRALIESAIHASERGARITRSLQAFAKESNLDPKTVNLSTLIDDLSHWTSSVIPDNIDVRASSDTSLASIDVDLAGVERTLLNLIINARDAMPKGGTLDITARNLSVPPGAEQDLVIPGEYVVLEVSDTGLGMEPEIAKRVFEPFFSTKSTHDHSGLGLSMAHGFMVQSGGAIHVESAPDQGTKFSLFFPARGQHEVESDTTENPGPGVSSKNLRILLAEDQPELLNTLKRILEAEGHSVVPAYTGDDAAEFYQNDGPFDLLITDIDMPGRLQGTDLAIQLKISDEHLPVIFLSGHSKLATLKQDDDMGLWLQKPIARQDLLEAIALVVYRRGI